MDEKGKSDPWDHAMLIALAIFEEWDAFDLVLNGSSII